MKRIPKIVSVQQKSEHPGGDFERRLTFLCSFALCVFFCGDFCLCQVVRRCTVLTHEVMQEQCKFQSKGGASRGKPCVTEAVTHGVGKGGGRRARRNDARRRRQGSGVVWQSGGPAILTLTVQPCDCERACCGMCNHPYL